MVSDTSIAFLLHSYVLIRRFVNYIVFLHLNGLWLFIPFYIIPLILGCLLMKLLRKHNFVWISNEIFFLTFVSNNDKRNTSKHNNNKNTSNSNNYNSGNNNEETKLFTGKGLKLGGSSEVLDSYMAFIVYENNSIKLHSILIPWFVLVTLKVRNVPDKRQDTISNVKIRTSTWDVTWGSMLRDDWKEACHDRNYHNPCGTGLFRQQLYGTGPSILQNIDA